MTKRPSSKVQSGGGDRLVPYKQYVWKSDLARLRLRAARERTTLSALVRGLMAPGDQEAKKEETK